MDGWELRLGSLALALWTGGCTPQTPLEATPAPVPTSPTLTAETRAAWSELVQRRCGESPAEPERPACDEARLSAALEVCEDARACVEVARVSHRCQGGTGVASPSDPALSRLGRVVEDDCEGFLEVVLESRSAVTPWWAGVPLSDRARACIARSGHPDVNRLLLLGGGGREDKRREGVLGKLAAAKDAGMRASPPYEALLVDPAATVAWMKRWLQQATHTPPGFTEAYAFWAVFDALPESYQTELLPGVRTLSTTAYLDPHRGSLSRSALERLGRRADAASIPALRAALRDGSNWTMQLDAAVTLGAMGRVAAEAKGDLEALAHTHWSAAVRAFAENAALRVAGQPARELSNVAGLRGRDPRYPEILAPVHGERGATTWRTYEPWSVVLEGERVEFEPLAYEEVRLPQALESVDLATLFPDEPSIHRWRDALTAVEPVEGGWVVGTNMGEFGGGAYFVGHDGGSRLLASTPVSRVITWNGRRYVLLGIGHIVSQGTLARIETTPAGVQLRPVLELPEAPRTIGVAGSTLLQPTRAGVAVISADFEIEMRPYATRRPHPVRPPEGHVDVLLEHLRRDHDALEDCLAPMAGLATGCDDLPEGLSVWFDVLGTGELAAVAPRSGYADAYRRPEAPEVLACVRRVARGWTFPPFDGEWTTVGLALDRGAR